MASFKEEVGGATFSGSGMRVSSTWGKYDKKANTRDPNIELTSLELVQNIAYTNIVLGR